MLAIRERRLFSLKEVPPRLHQVAAQPTGTGSDTLPYLTRQRAANKIRGDVKGRSSTPLSILDGKGGWEMCNDTHFSFALPRVDCRGASHVEDASPRNLGASLDAPIPAELRDDPPSNCTR